MHVTRIKPEGLDVLCRDTKFTRKELQIMYRGFKQECPSGVVDEDTFKGIYAQFFPQGNSSLYAHHVFKAFDQDDKGTISFQDFVTGLSVLARGTVEEKLEWAFGLYDINGDGVIGRDEMLNIVTAIYDMIGKCAVPSIDDCAIVQHVDNIFQKMDINNDGVISLEEFMETCVKDDNILNSVMMFDTVL